MPINTELKRWCWYRILEIPSLSVWSCSDGNYNSTWHPQSIKVSWYQKNAVSRGFDYRQHFLVGQMYFVRAEVTYWYLHEIFIDKQLDFHVPSIMRMIKTWISSKFWVWYICSLSPPIFIFLGATIHRLWFTGRFKWKVNVR